MEGSVATESPKEPAAPTAPAAPPAAPVAHAKFKEPLNLIVAIPFKQQGKTRDGKEYVHAYRLGQQVLYDEYRHWLPGTLDRRLKGGFVQLARESFLRALMDEDGGGEIDPEAVGDDENGQEGEIRILPPKEVPANLTAKREIVMWFTGVDPDKAELLDVAKPTPAVRAQINAMLAEIHATAKPTPANE